MVSVFGARFAFAEGRLPLRLVSVGALGDLRWLHLYRLTPDLVGLRQFAVCLWSSLVGVSYFPVRHSAHIHGDHFVSFPDSCVSLTRHSYRVMFLGHLQDE